MNDDKDEITIHIDDLIDLNSFDSMATYTSPTYNVGVSGSSYTISNGANGTNGSYFYNTGNSTVWTNTPTNGSLQVKGDAEFDGDVKIKGRSIVEVLDTIEKRLAILQPNPKKLAKYEALQKAYEHYKTLEALCDLPEEDEDGS